MNQLRAASDLNIMNSIELKENKYNILIYLTDSLEVKRKEIITLLIPINAEINFICNYTLQSVL